MFRKELLIKHRLFVYSISILVLIFSISFNTSNVAAFNNEPLFDEHFGESIKIGNTKVYVNVRIILGPMQYVEVMTCYAKIDQSGQSFWITPIEFRYSQLYIKSGTAPWYLADSQAAGNGWNCWNYDYLCGQGSIPSAAWENGQQALQIQFGLAFDTPNGRLWGTVVVYLLNFNGQIMGFTATDGVDFVNEAIYADYRS